MAPSFDREDIPEGLGALIAEFRSSNQTAGIRLVGGLALRYFDRGTRPDLDSLHVSAGSDVEVAAAAARVAERGGGIRSG